MKNKQSAESSIDSYIDSFSGEIKVVLEKIRATIKKAAPEATETIKYAMPTFVLKGNLVHFAACKNHIGFYPAPSGIEAFKKELSGYKMSKGAIQFPYQKEIPLDLITKIVVFRGRENLEKVKSE